MDIDPNAYTSSIASSSSGTKPKLSEKKIREGNIAQLAIETIQSGNPIKTNQPIQASNNLSGLERTEQERMVKEAKLVAFEKKFVSFVNGLLEHGIVCSKRAEILGIKQVSSLDKNPRPANEVEVNFTSDINGLNTACHRSSN